MKLNKWLPDQLGQDIWKKKYQYNNETLDEWFDRVSNGNKKLKQLIINKKFLFGGRILANRGLQNKKKITYSNCYVLPAPEDNLESIFDVGKMAARTFSYGGGVGIDISKLAPKGSKVNNAAEQSSGSISFTDYYSMITGLISQNGRRGALMLSISSEHPDLEEFINLKTNNDKVTKANISIKISDEFMKSVKDKSDCTLTFTRPETGELISKTIKPYKLFEKLAENNWNYAEPGILFWDTINKMSLLNRDKKFKFAGTNPCG